MSHARPAGAKTTSPIWIRKDTDHQGRIGYRWTCDQHSKAKGFHHTRTFTDRWRASRGIEPRPHPWLRCMAGAVVHWHRYHTPAHTCCLLVETAPDGGPPIVPVAEPPSQPAMPPTLTARDHCPH